MICITCMWWLGDLAGDLRHHLCGDSGIWREICDAIYVVTRRSGGSFATPFCGDSEIYRVICDAIYVVTRRSGGWFATPFMWWLGDLEGDLLHHLCGDSEIWRVICDAIYVVTLRSEKRTGPAVETMLTVQCVSISVTDHQLFSTMLIAESSYRIRCSVLYTEHRCIVLYTVHCACIVYGPT